LTLIGKKSINGTGNNGNNGNNTIIGNSAVNKINGGNGDDQINGGAGNDVIDGSLGNDALTGGKGNDFFVLSTLIDSAINLDTILDFKSSGADKIHLSKTIFTQVSSITPTAKGVALSSSDFLSSTSVNEATNSGQHILYNKSTGALYYDADGSGSNSAVQIALIGATPQHPELIAKDFFVII
jgi:Ca2+-binding RTX toxin-like protein